LLQQAGKLTDVFYKGAVSLPSPTTPLRLLLAYSHPLTNPPTHPPTTSQAASSPSTSALFLRRGLASLPGYVTSAPAATSNKLSNGVSVATEAGPGDLAVVSVWIDSGSRYEAPSLSGASNLIARLALKGYEKEVAKIGGAVKSWTSREMTVVSATVLKADVPAATALLGQVVTSPKFSDADVDAEKAAVLAEMESVTVDAHEQLLFEHLHATAFQVSFSCIIPPSLLHSLPPYLIGLQFKSLFLFRTLRSLNQWPAPPRPSPASASPPSLTS